LLVGYPVLTAPPGYRCQHCRHHANLWDSEKDPKAIPYDELGLGDPSRLGKRLFVCKHVLAPLGLLHVPRNLSHLLRMREDSAKEKCLLTAYWAAITIVALLTDIWPLILMFWIVPFLTSFQVIRYWNDMADHAGLAGTDPGRRAEAGNPTLSRSSSYGPSTPTTCCIIFFRPSRMTEWKKRTGCCWPSRSTAR